MTGKRSLAIINVIGPTRSTGTSSLDPKVTCPASLAGRITRRTTGDRVIGRRLTGPSIGMFAGGGFKRGSDRGRFSVSSLFAISRTTLRGTFKFSTDTVGGLKGSLSFKGSLGLDRSVGLSGTFRAKDGALSLSKLIGLSSLGLSLSKVPRVGLKRVISGLSLGMSPSNVGRVTYKLLAKCRGCTGARPRTSCSNLKRSFATFLGASTTGGVVSSGVGSVVGSDKAIAVAARGVRRLVGGVVTKCRRCVARGKCASPSRFSRCLVRCLRASRTGGVVSS